MNLRSEFRDFLRLSQILDAGFGSGPYGPTPLELNMAAWLQARDEINQENLSRRIGTLTKPLLAQYLTGP